VLGRLAPALRGSLYGCLVVAVAPPDSGVLGHACVSPGAWRALRPGGLDGRPYFFRAPQRAPQPVSPAGHVRGHVPRAALPVAACFFAAALGCPAA